MTARLAPSFPRLFARLTRGSVRCVASAAALSICAGCGGGEIDVSQINPHSVLNKRPATFRDGGEPVSGTVVVKGADGKLLEEPEYRDGFPNGRMREWYENGQLKQERLVRFQDRGELGALTAVGPARSWCENGTLQAESDTDEQGLPKGVTRLWTCNGKPLLSRAEHFGPIQVWNEVPDSVETVLVEEGTRVEGGGWEGVHKQYWPSNGKPKLEERWVDSALDGEYKTFSESGEPIESGTYQAGSKSGTWVLVQRGRRAVTEYDPSPFVDARYADAFMAAAGIELTSNLSLRNLPVDLDKIRYYVSEGLVDPKKRLNFTPQSPGKPFESSRWTYAYVLGSSHALPLLVELGADPLAIDSEGRQRLHYCLYSLGHERFCSGAEAKRMIELGTNPNQADVWGNTPLHEAVKVHPYLGGIVTNETRLGVAKILMEAGADPDVVNGEGKTPLMLAVLSRQFPLATEMLNRSQKPTLTGPRGLNLIDLAFFVELGNQFQLGLTDEVRAFVELAARKGVDPAAKVGDMGTLREIAEQSGAIDLARFLAGLSA